MEQWPYVIAGDLEAALIQILSAAPEISTYTGGAPNVSTTLDGYEIGNRWVVISLEGGNFDWPVIAKARVDVNVFAETRTHAHDIAQICLAVLFREMGQPSPDFGLRTLEHKVETGLVRADDKLNDSPRYLFSLRTSYVPYSGV